MEGGRVESKSMAQLSSPLLPISLRLLLVLNFLDMLSSRTSMLFVIDQRPGPGSRFWALLTQRRMITIKMRSITIRMRKMTIKIMMITIKMRRININIRMITITRRMITNKKRMIAIKMRMIFEDDNH